MKKLKLLTKEIQKIVYKLKSFLSKCLSNEFKNN